MPLVRVTARPHKVNYLKPFGLALYHIVPAAFSSEQGPLTPGSICFMASYTDTDSAYLLNADVFIEIEAYDYEDRAANLDERAKLVGLAMEELFPSYTFAVWPKLVKAGWYRQTPDPDFDGDMSMAAAMDRARRSLGRTITFRDTPICMQCGISMVRAGSCFVCPSCGDVAGCD